MSIALLDVNALVALLWEEHSFHKRCPRWFSGAAISRWASSPITQCDCVRLLSNPAFTANPPSVISALRIVQTATESGKSHHFWNDDLPLSALRTRWSKGPRHKQITDSCLIALAIHHHGKLVTFDPRKVALAGQGNVKGDTLVILRP
jgi:toxin-antitoxin system PIN domain toxin